MTDSPSQREIAHDADSAERWVSGKSEQELLSDLKVYSARLRDNPRNTPDRLRVAAIQLRLGRVEEALVHYEGVLRAYVAQDQVMSAIALCRHIITIYPDIPRLHRILAALYARVPHHEYAGITPVTPIPQADDSFLLEDRHADEDTNERVNRVFRERTKSGIHPAISRDLLADRDLQPDDYVPDRKPVPLVRRKTDAFAVQQQPIGEVEEDPTDEDRRPIRLVPRRK